MRSTGGRGSTTPLIRGDMPVMMVDASLSCSGSPDKAWLCRKGFSGAMITGRGEVGISAENDIAKLNAPVGEKCV